MALQKSVTLPGGSIANYFSADRIGPIDEQRREALLVFNLYADASAGAALVRAEAAIVYFRGAGFDAYFSKAAMAAAGRDAYAQAYVAVVDATAAFKAKQDGATLTDAQKVLVAMGNCDIASDYGNSLVFDGATSV